MPTPALLLGARILVHGRQGALTQPIPNKKLGPWVSNESPGRQHLLHMVPAVAGGMEHGLPDGPGGGLPEAPPDLLASTSLQAPVLLY